MKTSCDMTITEIESEPRNRMNHASSKIKKNVNWLCSTRTVLSISKTGLLYFQTEFSPSPLSESCLAWSISSSVDRARAVGHMTRWMYPTCHVITTCLFDLSILTAVVKKWWSGCVTEVVASQVGGISARLPMPLSMLLRQYSLSSALQYQLL